VPALLVRRLLAAAALVWAVASVTFALVHLAPGDAADLLAPPSATAADAATLRRELGLDQPAAVQYGRWLARLARGDLGESFAQRRPVRAILAEAAPVSLALGARRSRSVPRGRRGRDGAGRAAALAARHRPHRAHHHRLRRAELLARARARGAVHLGATVWGLPAVARLPAFGVREPSGALTGLAAAADVARHAVLPVAVLAVVGAAAGRATRARPRPISSARSGVRTGAGEGGGPRPRLRAALARQRAAAAHRAAAARACRGVVAGSVFVETVFAWPGLGRVLVVAVAARDYPVVLALTVLYAAAVILANLAADLLVPLVDPRRRDALA
jgi:peptide/nickel transport system permease protein